VAHLRKALDPGAATLGAMPPFDIAEGHKLYRELLKPVEATWRGKRSLLVVPHRALGRLPFALLPTEAVPLKADQKLLFENYRQTPWLVRQVAVTQYPSANAFVTLRALPPGDPNRRTFAGFGDPLFNSEQLAEAQRESGKPIQLASAGTTVTRGTRLPLRNLKVARVSAPADDEAGEAPASNVANSSRLAQVPRLPDTGDEIREIAAALSANGEQDLFLQLRANEDQVRRADLSNRKIVMFATHGLVPGELDGLGQPALALTAPALAGVGGDGLLTMEEVLQLKLNADWVVLSACNTAAGDSKGGEAFSGLGRAFFYAGSRAMLVTQWPVETTSARALTTELFRRQAKDATLTRAEALRQAMLALIDGPGYIDPASRKSVHAYAHPLFWAPYALVGDGGR
jgi:CHAT domain-containing protein